MIAIYARVSTEEQAKHGFSLQEQIRQGRIKAGVNKVLEYIDEGYSGEFLDRPALTRLREDIQQGIVNKVICLDPDRLSRKLMNQLIISEEIEKRADLVFVNGEYQKTPEGMLFYQMRGAIAEFEKAKINERMSRGRREKARQGKVLRDFQIFGYDYDKVQQQFIINEDEAKVVKLIFHLLTTPNSIAKGINGIAKYLTDQGIPTKRGAPKWHRQVVRQILMNRAYIGEFYQNRWNTEGMLANKFRDSDGKIPLRERPKEEWILIPSPPIIDEDQFNHVQKILQESRRRWAGKPKQEYFLSGLLRCGECNNTMTGRRSKHWGNYVLEYCDIKNTAGAKNKGCKHIVRCENIDDQIWNTVYSWLIQADEIASTLEEQANETFEEAELKRLDKEIYRIQNGKNRLLNLLTDTEDIGIDDIRNKLKDLNQKEQFMINQKYKLVEYLSSRKTNETSATFLQKAINFYLKVKPNELTFVQKRELVRMVIREIRIFKNGKMDVFTF